MAIVNLFPLEVSTFPTPEKRRNGFPRLERLVPCPPFSNGVYHIRKEFSRKEAKRDFE
jgi:hypothetical protein